MQQWTQFHLTVSSNNTHWLIVQSQIIFLVPLLVALMDRAPNWRRLVTHLGVKAWSFLCQEQLTPWSANYWKVEIKCLYTEYLSYPTVFESGTFTFYSNTLSRIWLSLTMYIVRVSIVKRGTNRQTMMALDNEAFVGLIIDMVSPILCMTINNVVDSQVTMSSWPLSWAIQCYHSCTRGLWWSLRNDYTYFHWRVAWTSSGKQCSGRGSTWVIQYSINTKMWIQWIFLLGHRRWVFNTWTLEYWLLHFPTGTLFLRPSTPIVPSTRIFVSFRSLIRNLYGRTANKSIIFIAVGKFKSCIDGIRECHSKLTFDFTLNRYSLWIVSGWPLLNHEGKKDSQHMVENRVAWLYEERCAIHHTCIDKSGHTRDQRGPGKSSLLVQSQVMKHLLLVITDTK